MIIITYINSVINFLISRFYMIQNIHNIVIPISWINILFHGLFSTIELVFYFFMFKFFLNTLHLGTYFFNFFSLIFSKIGSFFVSRFSTSSNNQEFISASPQEIARVSMLVKQILQNSTQNSQSNSRRY